MRLISKIIGLSFVCAILSCSSESENKEVATLSLEEKISNLEASVAARTDLTEAEQVGLADLNKLASSKSQRRFITTDAPNKSFNFDDLGADRVEFNAITEPPYYSSCNDADMEVRRDCVEEVINAWVKQNFNPEIINNSQVDGRYEISASFLIDTEGKIRDVIIRNGYDKALAAETKRVLENLPQMQPGKHKGKPMAALYSLPVVYDIKS